MTHQDNDIVHIGKPEAMYEEFERKIGSDKVNTHYCPGCGHGRIQKYIAAAIDELGLQDRTIFLSSVGCSVFSYYYMDTGNIQCSHGRAPAVGTGVTRTQPNSVVISYQGDGDLAAIGGNEIIHAANRGENMVVFFINNAIYGMTGGQMAPTTTLGQVTLTTPTGRISENHGHPLKVSEIIATLDAPIYVERVSCTDTRGITITRRAIKKALKLVSERKGFCFVEILSACPTNWKKSAIDSIHWIKETLETAFKPGVYKDISADAQTKPIPEPIQDSEQIFKILNLEKGTSAATATKTPHAVGLRRLKIAGFGGQGILTSGLILANAAMVEGLETSWIPSYGPEMRGGTANCSVVISDKKIGSPVFEHPDVLIARNGPSLHSLEKDVAPGGLN
jgi:2-oxoisovalerate ferredoxin oxidoreductase beta subunit